MRIVLLFVMLALAGCTAPEPVPEPSVNAIVVDDGQTRLQVVVYDQALRPLDGATVEIVGASSGETVDGAVNFLGLEAGVYVVNVSREAFVGQTTFVELDGETTARIMLAKDPAFVKPFHQTTHYKGFINGTEAGFSRSSGSRTFYSDCECNWVWEPLDNEERHFVEIVWEDSIDKPIGEPRSFRFLVTTDQTFDWFIASGPSPLQVEVPVSHFEVGEQTESWEIMVYTEEDWVTLDQPFDLFITTFVAQDIPDGFSAM